MRITISLAALLCLAATPSFARSWPGYSVDAKCYQIEEQNVNRFDTNPAADSDKDLEIRLCSPNAKTKSFAVVPSDWMGLKLDSEGNAKAAELVRKSGKRSVFPVTVTGEESKHTIKVDSISISE